MSPTAAVLAHGAVGPADELVLLLPVAALLVVAVGALRSHNAKRRDAEQPTPELEATRD